MSESERKFVDGVTGLVLSPPTIILRGYVLAKLWLWFVVPTFGVPPLTVPQALGLALIVSTITYRIDLQTNKRSSFETAILSALLSFIILAIGAIIAWFL